MTDKGRVYLTRIVIQADSIAPVNARTIPTTSVCFFIRLFSVVSVVMLLIKMLLVMLVAAVPGREVSEKSDDGLEMMTTPTVRRIPRRPL